ncbi:MAG: AI-2E family transporter, partial [Gallionella sp.]
MSFRFLQDKVRHDFARILPEMTLSRSAALQWLIFAVVVAVLMYLLSPILTPFVAAAILAYICNPLVQRLCGFKIPRTLAVLLVMGGLLLLFILLLLIMVPLLEKEVSRFVTLLPDWIESARAHLLPRLQNWFGADLQWDSQAMKDFLLSHSPSAGGVAEKIWPWLSSSGGMIIAVVLNLLLIPVAMFYMLRDWNDNLAQIDNFVPRHFYLAIKKFFVEVDHILAEFLRGQIAVMLLMSVYYVVVLWLVGL